MKLNETKPYLESAGELEEQFFAIQDQGMLFEILRKKMYSNPILAICREISCNARDAHREVGAVNVPIQIQLPSNLEPYYKVKDFGPGISPDRMSNVFIKYTASTKRSDNIQTGGFGLGAKTPFSYSDTFSITTVHNGIKYEYVCVIDETKVGKLMLTSQSPSKAKNGTEIIIPVLPKNFIDFNTYTERACRHWQVKPVIKGGTIDWQTFDFILEGDKWAITHSDDDHSAKMIIDDIEYPLDLSALRNYADTKLIDAARGNFIMYFGVGELTLSASRESIYLDERTKNVVRDRIEAIRLAIKKKTEEKIESLSNLWEANIYYNKNLPQAFNNIDFLGKLSWKGIQLTKHHMFTDTPVYCFQKGKYSRKYGSDPNKLSRSRNSYAIFEENTELYFNDLSIKEPTTRHVRKAFDNNANLKYVFVVCESDDINRALMDKRVHLDKMEPKLLSSITKATGRAYTPAAQRVLVFKFDARHMAFRQTGYDAIDKDANLKVLCMLQRNQCDGSRYTSLGNNNLSYSHMKNLVAKFPNFSFYGVDEGITKARLADDFSDLMPLKDFIQANVVDNKSIDYLKIKYAIRNNRHVDSSMLAAHELMKKLVKDSKSLYYQLIASHVAIRETSRSDSSLLEIYEHANGVINESQFKVFERAHPHLEIERITKQFHKKYPLLKHVNKYDYKDIVGELADYINLIDTEKANV